MADVKALMQEKIKVLDEASKAYYARGEEIMSNFEYDKIYDELVELEKQSGIILAGSPTQKVGYEILSELPKEVHPSRMLSLDKTKSREELKDWLGDHQGILSWKLDGLTIVLTYEDGKLLKAVTRGNGDVGEVITANAKTFVNLPHQIAYKGALVLRGEAVISYADFDKINSEIEDSAGKYKNPRNLCAGSVRQLNSEITASRRVRFFAFTLVSAEDMNFKKRSEQINWLKDQGFDTVKERLVNADNIIETVDLFESEVHENPIPSDGLVLAFDDLEYSASLGTTAKFPRDSIAFKWQDQTEKTTLREIEWNASRTGLINPIAVFDPVELEGTTVSRASVHNLSIVEELALGIGDTIEVYKANMIIPQISANLTRSGNLELPKTCPACDTPVIIKNEQGVKTINCPNPKCPAKRIKSLTLFVSRDAMNIDGLSEATIEKFADAGYLKELADFYHLDNHKDEIVKAEGFGEKSFNNMQKAIDASRKVKPEKLLYALGIPGIGVANAKLISKACKAEWDKIESISKSELLEIDGIGDVMAEAYVSFFGDEENKAKLARLKAELDIDESFEEAGALLKGLTFVITGSLNHYANRDELKALIESLGGKVSGSVSAKTSYLINNDTTSTSGKNKKAKELGIAVIDEEKIKNCIESEDLSLLAD